jgi:pyrroline-5-carboxylate reductase
MMDTKDTVKSRKIAFVGGGQMATALIRGLLRSGWRSSHLVVVEPDHDQRHRLTTHLDVRAEAEAGEILVDADSVVWAVKPQVLRGAIQSALPHVSGALHLSIAAGIPTGTLSRWLGSKRVIRIMPNTPAIIGSGVTGMLAMEEASAADRQLAEALFKATGYCFWVSSDERIDAVTAVSGSGPGYVFEFLSSFEAAARGMGFSPEQARELVVRTALGALQQAASETTEISVLRDRVTSKGGTTEAGLRVLSHHHLPAAVKLAVASAYDRAKQLSAVLSQD